MQKSLRLSIASNFAIERVLQAEDREKRPPVLVPLSFCNLLISCHLPHLFNRGKVNYDYPSLQVLIDTIIVKPGQSVDLGFIEMEVNEE